MKTGLVDGQAVLAGPDAPRHAACPHCGEPVELRQHRPGAGQRERVWYFRHCKGAGAHCVARVRSLAVRRPRPVASDPYAALGLDLARRTIAQARAGCVQATLALAFSPLIALALDLAGVTPEEALDELPLVDAAACQVVFADEPGQVARQLARQAGPVFDLHPPRNGQHDRALLESPWYVPLYRTGPATAFLVRRVSGIARWIYVLGTPEQWEALAP